MTDFLRILFIVPYAPTLIRTRPYNLVRFLARRGHRITLATLWEHEDERAFLGRLAQEEGIQVLAAPLGIVRKLGNLTAGLFTGEPLQARYCWSSGFASRLVDAVREGRFDVIHVEHLRGVRYALHLQSQFSHANPKSLPPIVWDSVDSITHLFEQASQQSQSLKGRAMTKVELGRTRRYETWLLGQFQHVLVTSPKDKAALEALRSEAGDQKSEVRGRKSGAPISGSLNRSISQSPNPPISPSHHRPSQRRGPALLLAR